jgi:hypothetical protein
VPEVNRLRRLVLVAAALLLAAACAAPPPADPECEAHRSWFPQRAAIGVWDDCVRHLGEAWCRRCLIQ